MTRQLTRKMTINLDQFARTTLMHGYQSNEDMLEVYRWIAVTASEHGKKWKRRDPHSWKRYAGIQHELGLANFKPYPLSGDEYGLCFTQDSSEYMPKVRQVITRAAFGMFYRVRQWRADHGLRKCDVPCRVLRAGGHRHDSDPLRSPLYFDRPVGKATPIIRGLPIIKPSFNEIHPSARGLHYFTLRPEPEGWRLVIVYGIPEDGRISSVWRAHAEEGRPGTDVIPVQGPNESVNEFLERCCVYARSILVSEEP